MTRNTGGISSNRLSRLGLIKNDHLPSSVLETRKWLIERLGSVSLTKIRLGDALEVHHAKLDSQNHNYDSTSIPTEQAIMSSHFSSKTKPPARIWDAFRALKAEVFKSSEEKDKGGFMAELPDYSICLEKFEEGDELIRFCCNRKFPSLLLVA